MVLWLEMRTIDNVTLYMMFCEKLQLKQRKKATSQLCWTSIRNFPYTILLQSINGLIKVLFFLHGPCLVRHQLQEEFRASQVSWLFFPLNVLMDRVK